MENFDEILKEIYSRGYRHNRTNYELITTYEGDPKWVKTLDKAFYTIAPSERPKRNENKKPYVPKIRTLEERAKAREYQKAWFKKNKDEIYRRKKERALAQQFKLPE